MMIMMVCLHSFVFQSVTWGRVIFEKPLFVQILKFPSSNGTQKFFTAFCKACNWPLYLLTPWCRVLLEKLTGLQLVKKFPAFYGT